MEFDQTVERMDVGMVKLIVRTDRATCYRGHDLLHDYRNRTMEASISGITTRQCAAFVCLGSQPIDLSGFDSRIHGDWIVTRVDHAAGTAVLVACQNVTIDGCDSYSFDSIPVSEVQT